MALWSLAGPNIEKQRRRALFSRFNWGMFLAMMALIGIGCAMIYSAYEASREDVVTLMDNTVFRQVVFTGIGLIFYLAAVLVDYHVMLRMWRWLLAFCVVILGVTALLGQTNFGAQSWLELEYFGVQPSELCKIMLIVILAHLLEQYESWHDTLLPTLVSGAVVAIPIALIYLQPDAGTALVVAFIWVVMVFMSGIRWVYVAGAGLFGALAVPVAWFQMETYMRDRFLNFLFPDRDPAGATYNIRQALTSIGSGGLFGKGYLQGTQSQLYFLRVRHTDFIFSVLAEEFGFIGCLVLISLFVYLLFQLLKIANDALDAGGRLIAIGVAAMIGVQMFVNMGMNMSILPVTGLPLPLVSYGGSSLVTTIMALGLAQSVAVRSVHPERPGLPED